MQLTKDQVKKVAKLANLPLTSEEEEKYGEQLSAILGYIEKLNQVDTSGVEPTYNVTGKVNVFSGDEVAGSLTQEEAIQNGSNVKNGFFVTKGVFESE